MPSAPTSPSITFWAALAVLAVPALVSGCSGEPAVVAREDRVLSVPTDPGGSAASQLADDIAAGLADDDLATGDLANGDLAAGDLAADVRAGEAGTGSAGTGRVGRAPAGVDVAALLPGEPIAPDVATLVRSWDDRNRAIFESDPASFVRVAAESEQFGIESSGGVQVFWAPLSDTGVLGGVLDGAGVVRNLVTITGVVEPRGGAVAVTSLALVADGADELRVAVDAFTEVADGDIGEQELVRGTGSAVWMERRTVGARAGSSDGETSVGEPREVVALVAVVGTDASALAASDPAGFAESARAIFEAVSIVAYG